MKKIDTGKGVFSKIDHIGVIVRDVDKAAEYYESIGIGPFEPGTWKATGREVPGKVTGEIKLKIKVAQLGQVQLELIQPLEGDSPQKEFLETKGEGIHHIGFFVNDLSKEVDRLVKSGIKVTYRTKFIPNGGCVYVETDAVGGVVTELIQLPE